MADPDYAGQAGLTAPGSGHNTRALQHRIAADARRGLMPVKILKVYGGGLDGPPTVDCLPLVHSVNGLGNATPHGPIYGMAVGRPHSGAGAFVSDPKPDDVFALVPADRDWSRLRRNGWQASAPDSDRRSSFSDGLLLHSLTGKVTQGTHCKPDGGVKVFDKSGAHFETSKDGKTVTVTSADGVSVTIDGGKMYLGGSGKDGSYAPVMTTNGPSSNVYAKAG